MRIKIVKICWAGEFFCVPLEDETYRKFESREGTAAYWEIARLKHAVALQYYGNGVINRDRLTII